MALRQRVQNSAYRKRICTLQGYSNPGVAFFLALSSLFLSSFSTYLHSQQPHRTPSQSFRENIPFNCRSISRLVSFFLISSRLSAIFFPLASPSNTFTRPRL